MKTLPVSVVIAVKNGERFLAQAIESILSQDDFAPQEIVVVDGNSTDATPEIATSFPLVRFMTQSGNTIADAYNCGVNQAKCEVIAFLSHDDLWTPNKFARQVVAMIEQPNIEYSYAHATFFLEKGHAIPRGFRPELLRGEHLAPIMETLVVRRGAFEKIGAFDEKLTITEDIDWYARAKDFGLTCLVVEEVLLRKRVHDTNASLNAPENNANMLEVLRRSIARQRAKNL